jgi:hypothetical protein
LRTSRLAHTIKLTFLARLFLLMLLVGLSFSQASPAGAQKEGLASIAEPNLENFPSITTYLDIHDAQGQFVSSLTPGEVTVLENERPLAVDELVEQQPGVRLVLAVNAAPALGTRNQQGITRYDSITQALQDWFSKQTHNASNDYSLLANTGSQVIAVTDPQAMVRALGAYHPDMRLAKPALQSLSQAIDLASDPLPQVGMGRVILYISPTPEKDALAGLPDLAARAQQMGVRIFVWIAASQDTADPEGLKILEQLAAVTGGASFIFNSSETQPDPGIYLEPLGKVYFLKYTSAINQSGRYSLAVKVTHQDWQVSSPARFFSISVQPPNPMFVSPPAQIERSSQPVSSAAVTELQPASQSIEIQVEFPDGHPRPLKAVRLYVDGIPVAENTGEPFDQFNLPLETYTTSTSINIKVEVEDSLGLTGASIETPVQVVVNRKVSGSLKTLSENRVGLAAGAAGLAGAALVSVLVVTWRRRRRNGSAQPRTPALRKPAGRPARRRNETTRPAHLAWSERLSWPRGHPTTSAPILAQLVRLSEQNQPLPSSPVAITSREVTFGRDPTLATVVIDLPSLDGLHARLRQNDDGQFILSDEGSVAGTWVNYAPITRDRVELEHADLVRIGQASFRFLHSSPNRIRKVVVKPYKETP